LKTIVIDVGKFWYHSAIELFPKEGIREIDAVILTHDHADACFGLDDLRDWTLRVRRQPLVVYVDRSKFPQIQRQFPYLTNTSTATGSGLVAHLEFKLIDIDKPFYVEGLEFVPLPVEHGKGYIALGYRFGRVAYISDANAILEKTWPLLQLDDLKDNKEKQKGLELLVLDILRPKETHFSHFCEAEALEIVKKLRPQKTLVIGMNHEFDHETTNERYKKLLFDGIDVQLAFDGQVINLNSLPVIENPNKHTVNGSSSGSSSSSTTTTITTTTTTLTTTSDGSNSNSSNSSNSHSSTSTISDASISLDTSST